MRLQLHGIVEKAANLHHAGFGQTVEQKMAGAPLSDRRLDLRPCD
jgi:hypothetical protein